MAGGIFAPLGSCAALEAASCHPLVCLLCREPYQQPCLLDCYHNFCAGCLRGRAADGRLACPLCGHPSVVKGGSGLPPVDRLLQFLVDGSAEGEEEAQCANCDLRCAKAPAAVRPVPRGDPPRQDVRPPRHRRPGQAHQGHPQEVPAPRGALHHVLHREEVHALHQLLPRHAGGEPRALHRHRDGVHAGLREARPGRHGRQGAADGHARGHRPAQGHGRGGAQQRQRGGDGHQLPLQQHAAGREEADAAEGGAEPARGEGEGVPGAARPPRRAAAHAAGPPGHLLGLPELRQQSRVPGPGLPTHGEAAEDRQAAPSPAARADQQDQHRVPGRVRPLPGAAADADASPLRGGQRRGHRARYRRRKHDLRQPLLQDAPGARPPSRRRRHGQQLRGAQALHASLHQHQGAAGRGRRLALRPALPQLREHLPDAAGGDPEPEGPGAGAAPRPHQAPLAHQDGDHERDPAEVAADGRADRRPLLLRGDDAQRLRGDLGGDIPAGGERAGDLRSPAPRPAAAEAGEQLPDHHHQADRPLRPLHRQGEGAPGAQAAGVPGAQGRAGRDAAPDGRRGRSARRSGAQERRGRRQRGEQREGSGEQRGQPATRHHHRRGPAPEKQGLLQKQAEKRNGQRRPERVCNLKKPNAERVPLLCVHYR
ncbi:RING finger protein 207 isoform X2 [Apteryx mantelli]|uniref:RING finger protein 207 isoform X2 n=1 Tax=Apteryx mantelli TaxID=2696672 RepID=A0ABM4FPW4_9AVES